MHKKLLTYFEMLIVPPAVYCVDNLFFRILVHLTVVHTVLVSVRPLPFFQIWILCQNFLTRELKISVVGFMLNELLAYFEMLIVQNALHCVCRGFFFLL